MMWAPLFGMSQGAVEWRREIEEAIRGCNKFVAFIDFQYLLSSNCIEVSPAHLSPNKHVIGMRMKKGFLL